MRVIYVNIFALLALFTCCFGGCAPNPVSPLKVLGVWHQVKSGDTVDKVSEKYGANPDAVAELNDISREGQISNREEIFIPKAGGELPGTGAAPSSPGPSASDGSVASSTSSKCGQDGRPCFSWPVNGKLTSGFGKRDDENHDGIDIVAPKGTPVKAADDGQVIYSGDQIQGYGNLVLLRHKNEIITVYAHNDKNLVSEGDKVKRGQEIAKVGDTGSATATHVHFEVRVNEQPMNPLLFLPTKE